MFFEGSLQDGIATAVQQSKLVMCLVTDDSEESQLWEADFLTDASLKERLETQAVMLRLQAGSQEAGYLEQLFPVPVKPTVIIIQNGQLKEYIAGGTPREEFIRRAGNAIGDVATQHETTPPSEGRQPTTPSGGQVLEQHQSHQQSTVAAETSNSSSTPAGTSQQSTSTQNARVQAFMAERSKRLEAEKKAQEAREKVEREERARARREAASDENNNNDSSIKPPERRHANEVRKQKQEAAEERRRILQRIEDDRREQKEQAAKDREARLLQASQDPPSVSSPSSRKPPTISDHCSIQVRLLDGSSMRARLASSATIITDIRPWVDRERTDGDSRSYTFRVVLSPLPNKAISPEEESSQSLQDLGLCPSATLVLVPKPGVFSSSAGGAAASGGGFFAYILAALSYVWASILAFLGAGPAPTSVPDRSQFAVGGGGGGGASTSSHQARNGGGQEQVRRRQKGKGTSDDRERVDDAQLYNGNSLNFEPRRDSDDEDTSQ